MMILYEYVCGLNILFGPFMTVLTLVLHDSLYPCYYIFFLLYRLGAIKGEGLSDVVCVVVRYFGTFHIYAARMGTAWSGARVS